MAGIASGGSIARLLAFLPSARISVPPKRSCLGASPMKTRLASRSSMRPEIAPISSSSIPPITP